MSSAPYHLAYVFERFPSFTQTFCAREILELERQGLRIMLFSIHDVREEQEGQFPKELIDRVHFLPEREPLQQEVEDLKSEGKLPQSAVLTLRHWGDHPDKTRVYESIYIGFKLKEAGVQHVHSHFAGIGARTCWWLRKFFGCTYSFTGHANDLFCKTDFRVTLNHLMRDAATIVTVSDFTVRDLQERFPEAAEKVVRVYNGLDLAPFAVEKPKEKTQPHRIVGVGRLIEKKGFCDLVTACSQLRDRNVKFECQIVGDGPLEEALREQVKSLRLEDKVHFMGALDQKEIIKILSKATLFCLPCVVEKDGGMDNLPTVIMEAMAASLPCVSTRLAGVPEMIIEGETGRLVEPGDTQALADALESLLGDEDLCRKMGEAGKQWARQHFDKKVTSQALRRALIRRGRVAFDRKIAWGKPKLWKSYFAQWMRYVPRLFCRYPKKVRDKHFDLEKFIDTP